MPALHMWAAESRSTRWRILREACFCTSNSNFFFHIGATGTKVTCYGLSTYWLSINPNEKAYEGIFSYISSERRVCFARCCFFRWRECQIGFEATLSCHRIIKHFHILEKAARKLQVKNYLPSSLHPTHSGLVRCQFCKSCSVWLPPGRDFGRKLDLWIVGPSKVQHLEMLNFAIS